MDFTLGNWFRSLSATAVFSKCLTGFYIDSISVFPCFKKCEIEWIISTLDLGLCCTIVCTVHVQLRYFSQILNTIHIYSHSFFIKKQPENACNKVCSHNRKALFFGFLKEKKPLIRLWNFLGRPLIFVLHLSCFVCWLPSERCLAEAKWFWM